MKPYQLVYTNSGTTGLRISLASAVTLCLILAIVLIGTYLSSFLSFVCAHRNTHTNTHARTHTNKQAGNDILPGQSGAYIRHVSTPVTSIFEGIYSNRGWGEYGNGSGMYSIVSIIFSPSDRLIWHYILMIMIPGEGSTLESTRRTRLIVELLVTRYGVNSLLDAPCGTLSYGFCYVQNRTYTNKRSHTK